MLTIHTSNRYLPEKEYCYHVVLRELLDWDFRIVVSETEKNHRLLLPNGSEITVEDHFFRRFAEPEPGSPPPYLHRENIPPAISGRMEWQGEDYFVLFGHPHISTEARKIACCADLFASAFFMLTRWEEYVLPDRDEHGRFPAEKSLAGRAGFLNRPVVNEYAALLRQLAARLGWDPPAPARTFRLTVTCDVDHPRLWWSAADRLRTLGGSLLRRGNFAETRFWLKNHAFRTGDPYDVFDEWVDLLEQNGLTGHFNFLGKRPPSSNCWYPLEHPAVRGLIRNLAGRGQQIGFHPSYEAFGDREVFGRELASLRAVSPVPVTTGRQHYLRFAVPDTWQVWEEAGMDWDSTLGYPEAEGFRCGICCDYPVFDILRRQMLRLREKPLTAMEVTLVQYRRYTPETAFEKLSALRRQTVRHNGEFVLLWHNSSWNTYFWAGWRDVFRAFISW